MGEDCYITTPPAKLNTFLCSTIKFNICIMSMYKQDGLPQRPACSLGSIQDK